MHGTISKRRKVAARKKKQASKQSPAVVVTDWMTTKESAAYLKLSRQFLEAARYRGDDSGPEYIKLERAVRYHRSALDAWMTKHHHAADRPI